MVWPPVTHDPGVATGTGFAAGMVLPKLVEQLLDLRQQRDDIPAQVQALVEAHPLYEG